MRRWTSNWAALLVAGFLAVPGTGLAQTPAAPAASATQEKTQQGTPQEHLQAVDAALNSIAPTAVTGKAKSQLVELKKHVNALETIAGTSPAAGAEAKPEAASTSKWSAEAAAADKILGEMLADAPAAGAGATAAPTGDPRPTGTSGTSKAAAVALDDETRAKLTSARSSLMAFAAAMSGSASAPAATASPSAAAPSTAAPSTAAPSTATPPASAEPTPPASPAQPPAEPTPTARPTAPPTEPTSPAAPPTAAPAQPPASTTPAQPPASATPDQPPASAAQADPAAGQPKVDADAAKRALSAARDSLSQMTQLPAAQQLSGEARTQVSQLIASFNELITTNAEWKASYSKVDANLTALIGAQTADESPAAPTAGTAGAVGTAGSATGALDPGIKAKLVEFRTHLKEFEKAASGTAAK